MKYYISRYLNIINTNYGYLFFSGVNGAIDEVRQPIAEAFNSGDISKVKDILDENEIKHMLDRGYLTKLPPDREEAAFIKLATAIRQNQEKKADSGSIMLLLSYDCNLACPYCYQKEHKHKNGRAVMSEELIDLIFTKIYSKLVDGLKLEKTRIMFYGGEPFLPKNKQAINKALEWARKYNMPVSAITNATQADLMKDIFGDKPGFVNWCQVSIDGARRLHNISRVAHDGRPTFDKILSNVKMMLEKGVKVSLRLNLDRKKLESIEELMQELKDVGILGHKNLNVYASPLHDNIAKVDATDFMDLSQLSEKLMNKGIDLEHPVSSRANEMNLLFRLKSGLGLNRTDFCMQSGQRTVVVDPFGDIYSCFEEAGYRQYRIGVIKGEDVEFFPLKDFYKNRHIANLKECSKCSVALACGGQCGAKCRVKNGDVYKVYCENMKSVILESLKFAYEKYRKDGAITQCERVSTHD